MTEKKKFEIIMLQIVTLIITGIVYWQFLHWLDVSFPLNTAAWVSLATLPLQVAWLGAGIGIFLYLRGIRIETILDKFGFVNEIQIDWEKEVIFMDKKEILDTVKIRFSGAKNLLKDLTGEKFQEAVGCNLLLEYPYPDPVIENILVKISPVRKSGDQLEDYDWRKITLPTEDILDLLQIAANQDESIHILSGGCQEAPEVDHDSMTMKDWLAFFRDKRFGWRFKLANLIMGDSLRNCLAVSGLLPLSKIIDATEEENDNNVQMHQINREARKARKTIVDVMEY